MKNSITCKLCNSSDVKCIVKLNKKPEKETDYFKGKVNDYYREIYYCNNCGVYFNIHSYALDELYQGQYNETSHKKIFEKFSKIINLNYDESDNKQRTVRIKNFIEQNINQSPRILDVGSGLGVFPYELKKLGFEVHCIDPDQRAIEHALNQVKVDKAHKGTLFDYNSDIKFDLITFNKVLEHIETPLSELKKAKTMLKPEGFIYIEVPDAKNALNNGDIINREEFYLEHYFIFNKKSFGYLLKQAELKPIIIKEIHEPSGKYTIFAFARNKT